MECVSASECFCTKKKENGTFELATRGNRKEGLIIQFKTNTPQWLNSVEHHFYITGYIKLLETRRELNKSLHKPTVSFQNNKAGKQEIS